MEGSQTNIPIENKEELGSIRPESIINAQISVRGMFDKDMETGGTVKNIKEHGVQPVSERN